MNAGLPVHLSAEITPARELTAELSTRFLDYLDPTRISPRTIQTYHGALKQFFSWLRLQGISQPDRASVRRYALDLSARGLRPSTISAYLGAIRLFFAWTADEGFYPDISGRVKGPKVDKGFKKDSLNESQVWDILERIKADDEQGARDYAMLLLMVQAGLRTIEVVRADIGDFGQPEGVDVLHVHGKGKTGKAEVVLIDIDALTAVRRYLSFRRKAGGNVGPDQPLFTSTSTNHSGQRLTTRSISRIAKQAMKAAGFDSPRLTAHSLRHSTATIFRRNGGTLENLRLAMRHVNEATSRQYDHSLKTLQNDFAQVIGNALRAARPTRRKRRAVSVKKP